MNHTHSSKPTLLITGGCGKIGAYFARAAAGRYALRLADRAPWDAGRWGAPPGEVVAADLRDPQACRAACAGMELVVHLAADADPEADFMGSLLENNVLATYHLFRAAKEAGCRRLVYASSAHAVAAYPADVQIRAEMPVRPTSMYGVSKCFGEALAAHYAVNEGMACIAVRIGAYLFPEEIGQIDPRHIDAYLHPDDLNDLLLRCLERRGVTFAVVHAISDNRCKRLDISAAREAFGYAPRWDGFALWEGREKG